MSKLDELIEQYCPHGIQYKTLGELGKFYGGLTGKSKEDFTGGNAAFITYKNVYSNPALDINPADRVRIGIGEKQRALEYGDVIFTGSSETPDECGISSVVTERPKESLYLNSFCFIFRFNDISIMLPDFAKHLFRSSDLRYQIGKTASGVTRFNVSKKLMEKVSIPVPPLEVQREIVRVLDSFTLLTAELTAELTARKKQYDFYASGLIANSSKESVEMSEIAEFVYGYTDKASDFGNARFIRITDINDQGCLKREDAKYITLTEDAKKSLLNKGDLVMARTGATYGKTLYFDSDEPSVYASFLIRIIPDNKRLLNRFYWHFTKTPLYWEQANKLVSTGGQPQFNTPAVKQVRIPLPSIDEQKRIIDILDRFDAMCTSMSVGLPAEIDARKKQYSYYRDKLLSFKFI